MERIPLFEKITDEEYLYRSYEKTKKLRGTLIEIHISDIHFGVINPEYQYNILKEQFIDKIKDIPFDVLSVDGDLFDHKFMSNTDTIMYATLFIDNLVSICKKKNSTLVLLAGTQSHDENQLKLFYHYLDDNDIDIRIVEKVKFEYIKGSKILCIPELYGMGKEYYNIFLFDSGIYDEVFMHGNLKGAVFARDENKGLNSEHSPIFNIHDFDLCRGPIMSGHVHIGGCFNKHFYYCGSPLRFRFEEEEPKGFLILLDNLDSTKYFVHFEEIFSHRYITININDLLQSNPKDIVKFINDKKKIDNIDYFKIKIDKDISEKELSTVELLKQYFRTNKYIKLEYTNQRNKEIIKMNEEEIKNNKDYDFILDKNLSDYDKLAMYICKQEGDELITGKEIIDVLEEEI